MPPEYHLQSFWDARFRNEQHFEWLGDGQHTIVPHLRNYLQAQRLTHPDHRPRILHIGAGNSTLSDHVCHAYQDMYAEVDERRIVNVDFSETAVQRGIEDELSKAKEGHGGGGMQWVCADVLRWDHMKQLRTCEGADRTGDQHPELFDVVLDKSTSDAISCGDDIAFDRSDVTTVHPALVDKLNDAQMPTKIDPVVLLAMHLASLVRAGGIWIVLSFSSSRIRFLSQKTVGGNDKTEGLDPALLWTVEETEAVAAPSGNERPGVYAPPVYHYVYVLRRTNHNFDP